MNIDDLRKELTAFFKSEDFTLEQLVGGASRRKFIKIDFLKDAYFPVNSVVLMIIPRDAAKMFHDYVYLDYYFKRLGVARPSVYEVHQDRGWVFMDYIANPTVEQFLHEEPEQVFEVLSFLVDHISDLQQKCRPERNCPAFLRRFDAEKYRFEFKFHFKEQLLAKYFALPYDEKSVDYMGETISQALDLPFPIFVHRDFQSSNVFIDPEGGMPRFMLIDFQDARSGNPLYDVVACLWDSYIKVTTEQRWSLMSKFRALLEKLEVGWEDSTFERLTRYTVIQRKIHDAGAFAFNFRRTGHTRYVGFIEPTLRMVQEEMSFKDLGLR